MIVISPSRRPRRWCHPGWIRRFTRRGGFLAGWPIPRLTTVSGNDRVGATAPRWHSLVPGIALVANYRREWLAKDIVAGLVLSALLVPQGMAYAELAGLPPVTGLYTSILCLIGYAIFGPSRVLVLGPDSALGSMIAATTAPLLLADGDPARAIALASLLAIFVGVVMVVAGLAKFGFVADLLSKPTQIGYMNGLALTILISQLPKLFGFSVDADGLLRELGAVVTGVVQGAVNVTAAAVGIASLVGILLLNRWLPKLPSVLIVVVLTALTVNFLDLADRGVDTIGVLPQGFPPFTLPLRAVVRHPGAGRSARSPSPWSRWPTPCRRRRRSPPGGASRCEATRR